MLISIGLIINIFNQWFIFWMKNILVELVFSERIVHVLSMAREVTQSTRVVQIGIYHISQSLYFAEVWLNDFDIAVTDVPPPANVTNDQICAYQNKTTFQGQKEFQCHGGAKTGRYVVIWLRNQGTERYLPLCEVVITRKSEYQCNVTINPFFRIL